jgi:hypothetical protein
MAVWVIWPCGNSPNVLLSAKSSPVEKILGTFHKYKDMLIGTVRPIMGGGFTEASGPFPRATGVPIALPASEATKILLRMKY